MSSIWTDLPGNAVKRLEVEARTGRAVPDATAEAIAADARPDQTSVSAGADAVPADAPDAAEWRRALAGWADTDGPRLTEVQRTFTRRAGIRQPSPGAWGQSFTQRFVADYKPFNFVDGEGVRCSLYVSGCPFRCPGCYNKAAQSFRYGHPYTAELEDRIMADLAQSYVQGLTLVGGEPFLNTDVCLALARRLRHEFGSHKDVWAWSGYTFEQLLEDTADKRELLGMIDVLVDGPFVRALYDSDLAFRGSSNQRIIDVPASLAAGAVRLWKNGQYR